MQISRSKSWTYGLFHLVHSDASDVSWPAYYVYSLIGLLLVVLVVFGGYEFSLLVNRFCIHHPLYRMNLLYSLGGLMAFILVCRIPFVHRFTVGAAKNKFLSPVAFVD